MQTRKLLVAVGVVAVLTPALAASAMKGGNESFNRVWQQIDNALGLMGLAPLPAKSTAAPEQPGPTRLPFIAQPKHMGFPFAELIAPGLMDFALKDESAKSGAGNPVGGGIGGLPFAAALDGASGSGEQQQTAANGAINGNAGFGGAGLGGPGFGGGGGMGGAGGGPLELAQLDGQTLPEIGLDSGSTEIPVTVAPVPASIWMMLASLAGLLSLGVLRRRHRG